MTSIPVRKGTGVYLTRRSKDEGHSPPHEETQKNKTRTRFNSREDNGKHRPLTRKELAEENEILRSDVKGHESRLKELETLLRLERDKVSSVRKESSKRETEQKENLDDLSKRSDYLEARLEAYEKKLLKCNIDPVTLESLEPESKESESETKYEQAKIKVRLIKEKFKEFNLQALQNIDNLQVMNTQLDDVITSCQSLSTQDSDKCQPVTTPDDKDCLNTSDDIYF